jgi:hypothetical protein
MEVDLRGTPRRDYGVRIRGGVGEATVRLPHDAGIYAEASGGLGQVNVRGLHRENGYWVNDAYRSTAPKIRVDIQGGVGSASIYLPKDVGVKVHASGGIGAISTHGMTKEDDDYVNAAYGKTPVTITLEIQGGVGAIDLVQR